LTSWCIFSELYSLACALAVAHETVLIASATARKMLSLTVKAFTAVRSLALEVVKVHCFKALGAVC
jgi:hypothetical protein